MFFERCADMKRPLTLLAVLTLTSLALGQVVYTVDYSGTSLRTVDPTTGLTLTAVPTAFPMQGLAIDPVSGNAYVVDQGFPRSLYLINLTTGATTLIGSTGLQISGLTMDASGNLYGIEGDGGTTPGSLHAISTVTAGATLLATYGSPGADGEEIAWNPADGLIYRLDRQLLSSIDPNAAFAETAIVNTGVCEINGMGFSPSGDILASSICNTFNSITTAGVVTALPALDHQASDIAMGPPPPPSPFPGTGEDLITENSVNGGGYVTADSVTLNIGDTIAVRHLSPGGTFDLLEFVAYGSVAPTGSAVSTPFPGIHLLSGGTVFSTVSGGLPGVPLTLPPGGVAWAGVHIGGALSGVSALVQGASITGTAVNMIFASTDGFLIAFN